MEETQHVQTAVVAAVTQARRSVQEPLGLSVLICSAANICCGLNQESLITPAKAHATLRIYAFASGVYLLTHNERLKLICEHEPAYGQTPGGTQGNIMEKPLFSLKGHVERNKINASRSCAERNLVATSTP